MKAGILTFHRALNIGAVLQAMALCEYINEKIMPCELIDFVPNDQVPGRLGQLRSVFHKVKAGLHRNRPEYVKERVFDKFTKKYYRLSDKTYYGDKSLQGADLSYDVLISGSDQILNLTLSGSSKSYYLNFVNGIKKVSYASSFGRSDITDEEKSLIKSELLKFENLSVREADGGRLIKEFTGLDSTLVVDPVFLLDRDFWSKMCKKIEMPGQYVFVYAMEYSDALQKSIDAVKEVSKMPVYILCGGSSAQKLEGKKLSEIGPGEFLYLIKNASYVVTNSFHGSALSIIFKKKFWCVSHSSRNVRLQNLMEECGREKLLIGIQDEIDLHNVGGYEIEGTQAYKKLEALLDGSRNYLESSLKLKGDQNSVNDADWNSKDIQILHDEDLSKYTTVRLGGTARTMFIPQSIDGLISVCDNISIKYVLGGGSNLLIANKEFDHVLNLRKFNLKIESKRDGFFEVGASVRIQKILRTINDEGFGGIEYLYTVPGLVGGSVAMNAGTSKAEGRYISDYVEKVFALDRKTNQIMEFDREDCEFSFRNSLFKNNSRYIITEVWFHFENQSKEESKKLCDKKREFSKRYQDTVYPNFGSVYSKFNHYIMRIVQIVQFGKKESVHFSRKSIDWIINENGNQADYAISLVRKVKKIHDLLRKECRIEVVIWE